MTSELRKELSAKAWLMGSGYIAATGLIRFKKATAYSSGNSLMFLWSGADIS